MVLINSYKELSQIPKCEASFLEFFVAFNRIGSGLNWYSIPL